MMKCKTQRERLTSKLKALRTEARPLMHASMEVQYRWFCRVLPGHYAYYGRPHNIRALEVFLEGVRFIWHRLLRRRSQKSRNLPWATFVEMTSHFNLPQPRIVHPW